MEDKAMPLTNEWVDNEVAVDHKGVKVYHVYRNDMIEEPRREYHFGLTPMASDCGSDDGEFDVRDLKEWDNKLPVVHILKLAIDNGTLKNPVEEQSGVWGTWSVSIENCGTCLQSGLPSQKAGYDWLAENFGEDIDGYIVEVVR